MDNEDTGENPDLKKVVEEDNELKEFVVNYVGRKLNPETEEVTVEMIVEVFAVEFPEFLLAVAEENWIRGYKQAFLDLEESELEEQKTSELVNDDQ
tara:strand:- start:757 stop:1044 length:288 start_codon:yes stop_codon:yes gene_type:complete